MQLVGVDDWGTAPPLEGERLGLEPLRVDDAEEMAPLLDDAAIHAFTGGRPATLGELRERYARQVAGHSPDGSQRWLNWIVRRRSDGQAVGFVQATVGEQDGLLSAEVAWVIAPPYQRRGYAREAAHLMATWLREQHITAIAAHVHPEHHASNAVARSIGLSPTGAYDDGEARWQG